MRLCTLIQLVSVLIMDQLFESGSAFQHLTISLSNRKSDLIRRQLVEPSSFNSIAVNIAHNTYPDSTGMQQSIHVVYDKLSGLILSDKSVVLSSLSHALDKIKVDDTAQISTGFIVALIFISSLIPEPKRPPIFANVPEAANNALREAIELIPSIEEKLSNTIEKTEERLEFLFDSLTISLKSLRSETNELKQSNQQLKQELMTIQLTYDKLKVEYEMNRNMIVLVQSQFTDYCKTLKDIEAKLVLSGKRAYYLRDEIQNMKKQIQILKSPKGVSKTSKLSSIFDQHIWFANTVSNH